MEPSIAVEHQSYISHFCQTHESKIIGVRNAKGDFGRELPLFEKMVNDFRYSSLLLVLKLKATPYFPE